MGDAATQSPGVSIIMPVRNARATLDAVLADLAAQTFDAWELILVNDGSTDGSDALARAWSTQDRRIRVIDSRGRGIVDALRQGSAESRCPLLARMDADDRLHPERLAVQVAFLTEHTEIGLVATQVAFGGDRRRSAGFAAHVDWSNGLLTPEAIHVARFVDAPVVHPTVMFRRTVLDTFGSYGDDDVPEDYELWLRWLGAGVAFAKIPRELVTWVDSPARLTRIDPRYARDRHAILKCRYLAADCRDRSNRGDDRPIWIWGAGRVTRRRFDALAQYGIAPNGYIDIDPRKVGRRIGGRLVVGPDDLPPRDGSFVIAGVGTRGAGALIRAQLLASGRVEGVDFLLAG